MTVFSILLSTFIPLSFGALHICNDNEPCSISPAQGDTIACGCAVEDCEIDVSNNNGKDITVYSFAEKTKLRCRDIDGCQASSILGGIIPSDITIDTNCAVTDREIEIECSSKTSCKDMNVTSYGIHVTVKATKEDGFDEGILDCFNVAKTCNLTCSDEVTSCNGAQCTQSCACDGAYCPDWTHSPTPQPVISRPHPETPEIPPPIVIPTYITCEGRISNTGECKLDDLTSESIVVVGRSPLVKTLKIECNTNQQCKNIKVYSAANTTEIECQEYQSCVDTLFYIGHLTEDDIPVGYTSTDFPDVMYNTVIAECVGEDSCKQSNITIRGSFGNNPMIMTVGSSSFSEGCLECELYTNKQCDLMCVEATPQSCQESQCKGDCVQGGMRLAFDLYQPKRKHARLSSVHTVSGSKQGEIILDNTYGECVIDCSTKDQCEEIEIYSGCNTTTINCGEASCKKATINVGTLVEGLPTGTTAATFSGNKKTVIINCNDYQACSEAEINIVGVFTVSAVVSAAMPNGLYKGEITSLTTDITVSCDNFDGCKDLKIECAETNQCVCDGGSCTVLDSSSNNAITNTPAPTQPSVSPTKKPTPNPTNKPTTSPTKSDLIVYTPERSGVYICLNNVKVCILDCNNGANTCDEGVKLLSAANNTEILCDAQDACKQAKIYLGTAVTADILSDLEITEYTATDFINNAAESVHLNCSADSACKEIEIKAVLSVSQGISIETKDSNDALKEATLNIAVEEGQSCSIECSTSGCKDTNWEASNIVDCSCSGTSCPSPARKSGIHYIPSNAEMNAKHDSHYPTFLPTAIIVCISSGLICLVAFCIYYKYFTNDEKKLHEYLNDNNGKYDTFQKSTSLEMNEI